MPKPKINPKNKKGPVYTLPPRQLYRASTWKKREPGPRGNFSPYKQGLFFFRVRANFLGVTFRFCLSGVLRWAKISLVPFLVVPFVIYPPLTTCP